VGKGNEQVGGTGAWRGVKMSGAEREGGKGLGGWRRTDERRWKQIKCRTALHTHEGSHDASAYKIAQSHSTQHNAHDHLQIHEP
jgi:hypothetical protein